MSSFNLLKGQIGSFYEQKTRCHLPTDQFYLIRLVLVTSVMAFRHKKLQCYGIYHNCSVCLLSSPIWF